MIKDNKANSRIKIHKLKSVEQHSIEVGRKEIWLWELLDIDCNTIMLNCVQGN